MWWLSKKLINGFQKVSIYKIMLLERKMRSSEILKLHVERLIYWTEKYLFFKFKIAGKHKLICSNCQRRDTLKNNSDNIHFWFHVRLGVCKIKLIAMSLKLFHFFQHLKIHLKWRYEFKISIVANFFKNLIRTESLHFITIWYL